MNRIKNSIQKMHFIGCGTFYKLFGIDGKMVSLEKNYS